MTNTSSPKQESVLRILAVAGLIALIILIAWLSVQIVKVAPNAFSSLASLAEGISDYEDTMSDEDTTPLSPILSKDTVASGDTISLDLNTESAFGDYTFSYNCVDGVSLLVMTAEGGKAIACDTIYNLGNKTNLDLLVESNVVEDTTISYSVSFSEPSDTEPSRSGGGTFLVTGTPSEDAPGEVAGETTSTPEETPVESEPAPQTPAPETVYEYVYAIPTSDPNGSVDLVATYVNVGGIVNGAYRAGVLEQDSTGALQFQVKNIGTKTSADWRFTVSLPNGDTYQSDNQAPLKPNERATLALSIDTNSDSSHNFVVKVETDRDRQTSNNSFSQRVIFLR